MPCCMSSAWQQLTQLCTTLVCWSTIMRFLLLATLSEPVAFHHPSAACKQTGTHLSHGAVDSTTMWTWISCKIMSREHSAECSQ